MRCMIALLGLATVVLSGCAVHSHDPYGYRPQPAPVVIHGAPVRHYAPRPVIIKQMAPRPVNFQPARSVAPRVVQMKPKPAPHVRPDRSYVAPNKPVQQAYHRKPAQKPQAGRPQQGKPHGRPSHGQPQHGQGRGRS